MASPHVTGAAALALQASLSASPATVCNALVSKATLNKLGGAATDSANRLLYTC